MVNGAVQIHKRQASTQKKRAGKEFRPPRKRKGIIVDAEQPKEVVTNRQTNGVA